MKNNKWSNNLIKELFTIVEEGKTHNKNLLKMFKIFANKYHYNTLSVRNFYYQKLKELEDNPDYAKELEIDMQKHKKSKQCFFSKEETTQSINNINKLLEKGYSVRKACQELSRGDLKTMVRLQNKYYSQEKQNTNVVVMPHKNQTLSDEDIGSLFLGLVRLVKKTAKKQAQEQCYHDIQKANEELKSYIKNFAEKEKEVVLLRKKFELLSTEKSKLKEEIFILRSQNAELLEVKKTPEKYQKLQNYINEINLNKKVNKK